MQRFFAPGRTELAGNHTDHQLGRVLAASVDVGITARATRRRDRRVCIHSKGYRPFTVALDDLAVDPRAYGKPWALVRGMAAAILDAGGAVGGFEAWASSALKPGGGLSSSAAFEILVGRIFNALYNGGAFSPEQLARFGQQAENRHFGKPSGLMDQLACALDGAVYIDFAAGEIAPVAAPFADMGLTLSLTDTGGSHAGLTAAYAALPADMCRVARRFGAETLSQVDPADFYAHRQPGLADDRAAHFFEENARVPLMRDALVHRDAETYLRLMNARRSSCCATSAPRAATTGLSAGWRARPRCSTAWARGACTAAALPGACRRSCRAMPSTRTERGWRRSSAQIPAASCTSRAQNKKSARFRSEAGFLICFI